MTGRRRDVARMALLGACALICGGGGCLITPGQQREDALIREARQFNDDLRWARWETAVGAMPPEEARLFAARAQELDEELVVADSEVTAINFGRPSTTAVSVVKIEWYTKRTPTIRSTTLEQRWEQRDGRWLMVKQRRARGDRFPLVPEPVEAPTAPAAAPGPASPQGAPGAASP